jgi:hypothetical protein
MLGGFQLMFDVGKIMCRREKTFFYAESENNFSFFLAHFLHISLLRAAIFAALH